MLIQKDITNNNVLEISFIQYKRRKKKMEKIELQICCDLREFIREKERVCVWITKFFEFK